MNLFQTGAFRLHSGMTSNFKIECDALTTADWETLAGQVASRLKFGKVIGVPRGGLPFARALEPLITPDYPTLVADDVFTTGQSISQFFGPHVIGVVLFARNPTPDWVHTIFRMW